MADPVVRISRGFFEAQRAETAGGQASGRPRRTGDDPRRLRIASRRQHDAAALEEPRASADEAVSDGRFTAWRRGMYRGRRP